MPLHGKTDDVTKAMSHAARVHFSLQKIMFPLLVWTKTSKGCKGHTYLLLDGAKRVETSSTHDIFIALDCQGFCKHDGVCSLYSH